MKTTYSEIVDVTKIGSTYPTSREITEVIYKASSDKEEEKIPEGKRDGVVMVLIDYQEDFMDNGVLGVAGAGADIERVTRFIHSNVTKIDRICCSLDTHHIFQIFHPSYWIRYDVTQKKIVNPDPFTIITKQDIVDGKWSCTFGNDELDYVNYLETQSKKQLMIWPYHCLQLSTGHNMEQQLAKMVYYHSRLRNSIPFVLTKGTLVRSEMYGIFKPEYSLKNERKKEVLNIIESASQIIIAGEAKSHCVLESIKQMIDEYKDKPEILKKIFILEDCTSSVKSPVYDFGPETDKIYQEMANKYKVNLVKSTDNFIK